MITDLIIEIHRRIKEYENTAEECYQELNDSDNGDLWCEKAATLKNLLEYIDKQFELPIE